MTFTPVVGYELQRVVAKEGTTTNQYLSKRDLELIGSAIRAGRSRVESTCVGSMLLEYEGNRVFVHPEKKGVFVPSGWFEITRFWH
jgi:hypothetical protein